LTPLAIGIGRGTEANVPLARVIIGAVLAATVLALLAVPVMYSYLGRFVKAEVEAEQEALAEERQAEEES
ncbi:MAG: efflux RND transporter permease subunit, partial [Planctomycetota bacterium]